jgi:geranylgeranyl pyrophosphate synthase
MLVSPSTSAAAEALSSYGVLLDRCRSELVRDVADSPCRDATTAYLTRGKLLRPLLVFAATAAVGAEPSGGLPGARAVELLHTASLIHDDIIDGAAERRGFLALHRELGVERALVVGDYLLLRSLSVLGQDTGGNRTRALETVLAHAQECCQGQVQELEQCDGAGDEREYIEIAASKTGAQFAAAAAVGAILGDGDERTIAALREYGAGLGIAFQIEDDLADLTLDSASLGKPAGNSLGNGRMTLPLIYLHRGASPERRARLRRELDRAPDPEARLALLHNHGVVNEIRARQADFVEAALTALEPLGESPALARLRLLPSFVLEASLRKDIRPLS